MTTITKDTYEIGEMPPLGHVPKHMYANLIRLGAVAEPIEAFQVDRVEVPPLKPDEVLIYVMAAGINGSDASGIVWAVGSDVNNVRVGDHVVVHCGMWDSSDPFIKAGGDPILSSTNRIWGYETDWGSFAQFAKAQAHQCLPKAPQLTWEAAAAPTLVGSTAYRMLHGWPPNTVKEGDVVLVWGGSGGLGSMAIQIAREAGAVPVAVVSSESEFEFCQRLGARGCINRKKFDHWGVPPHWKETEAFGRWAEGARAFGKAIWDVVGERKNPAIVFDHPGEDTIPTSIFVCDNGGMVVICAGTTGYSATVDLRYLWMRQKRLQGSHFANDEQCAAFNQMVIDGKIDPSMAKRLFSFEEIGLAHQLMYENRHPEGNMVALVGAPQAGLKAGP